MAGRPTRQMNRSNRYVSGNLAYDFDYLERERRRRADRERQDYEERREYQSAPRPRQQRKPAAKPKHRERIHVSPVVVIGFAVVAVMLVALLDSYAELTAVSRGVVAMQSELAALEDEHVALLGRYERTFDLSAVKEAAETAGMAKPSSSQIYYVDLSAPDSVILYQSAELNVMERAFSTVGQDVVALVEYFK
ncbi:MAG: hypothetical protein E7425_03870 [Ruminococcaceae bacterium]|jgi:hypothetical protein|nr:hypothetical protein [Oscillospiraceae bacterium]